VWVRIARLNREIALDPGRFIGFLLRRGKKEALLLAAASISILLAASVITGAPIYLRSLELLGIGQVVDDLKTGGQHIQVNTSSLSLNGDLIRRSRETLDSLATDSFGDLYVKQEELLRSARHYWGPADDGPRETVGASKAIFQSHSNINDHVGYLPGGVAPRPVISDAPDAVLEAAVYKTRADLLGVDVGDVIEVTPRDIAGKILTVKITGVFLERAPIDPFWLGLSAPILAPPASTAGDDLPLLLFVPYETITGPVSDNLLGMPASVTWHLFTDGELLRDQRATPVIDMVAEFEGDVAVEQPRPLVITALGVSLKEYRFRSVFTRAPMLMMASLALVASFYGLFMVTSIVTDRRRPELAVLRSRGVSMFQISRMHLVEAIPTIGIPVVIAPFLSAYVVGSLGKFGSYEDLTGGDRLPVELELWHFGVSILTGVVALLVIALPAIMRLRSSLSEEARAVARPDTKPLFQRFFFDIAVIAIGVIVWFELRERGALVSSTLDNEQSTDMTLLFAPALLLIVGVMVVLRFFPYVTAGAAWITTRVSPAWFALAFWRIARTPFQSAWGLLLVAFVTGTAIITGSLASTLELSQEERILYRTGSDIRIIAPEGGIQESRQISERLLSIRGVKAATSVIRQDASVGTTAGGSNFELFAIDPAVYADIGWFRDDFSGESLEELMAALVVEFDDPVVVPDGSNRLGMWVKADIEIDTGFVWLIVRGAGGLTNTVSLGQVEGTDWRYLSSELRGIDLPGEIVGVQLFQNLGGDRAIPTTLLFDDIEVEISSPATGISIEILEDFESERPWTGLPTSEGFDAVVRLVPELLASGQDLLGSVHGTQIARLQLGRGSDAGVRGMVPFSGPLPSIVSDSFLGETGLKVGDPYIANFANIQVPMMIAGSASYLSTLNPLEQGFMVTDIQGVRNYADQKGVYSLEESEAIVQMNSDNYASALPQLRRLFRNAKFVQRTELRSAAVVDPLVAAGWKGVALLAAVITVMAAFIGYGGAQAAHARRTGGESAFILVLGLSRGHFLRMLIVEHLAIAISGVALGVFGGTILSGVVVDAVSHTEDGGLPLPPIQLVTSWTAFNIVIAGLAATFLFSIVIRAKSQTGPAHGAIARIGIRGVN
jgi:hypothetical protein